MLIFLILFFLAMSVSTAEMKGPYIMSVDAIRDLKPGTKWDPAVDDVLVQVRGYLRNRANLYLYATRDQALLDDISGILVSDEGEGDLRRNCSDGFVELIARLSWMESVQQATLIPIEAKRLILHENSRAEEELCWKTIPTSDR
jgi:hypothetical protein